MSASMFRCFCCSGRNILQFKQYKTSIKHKRLCSKFVYNNNTVPYFPEQHAAQSLEAKYPEVEVSVDDFKYVERLIPAKTVPPPPEYEQYPTPSGWIPPNTSKQPSDYSVSRTRNHMFPLYLEKFFSGRIATKVRHINGDIWKCHDDMMQYLKNHNCEKTDTQVHEVGRFIRVKGNHVELLSKFLLEKGF